MVAGVTVISVLINFVEVASGSRKSTTLMRYWLSCASSSGVSTAVGGKVSFNSAYDSRIHFCRTGSSGLFETGNGKFKLIFRSRCAIGGVKALVAPLAWSLAMLLLDHAKLLVSNASSAKSLRRLGPSSGFVKLIGAR